jgi:hypothetical protein
VDEHVAVDMVLFGEALLAHRADKDLLVGRLPPFMNTFGVANQGAQGLECSLARVAQVLAGVEMHTLQQEQFSWF